MPACMDACMHGCLTYCELNADVLRKSGDSHVHLRHRDQLVAGKQPFETQSIKDRANMVGIVALVETLPSR